MILLSRRTALKAYCPRLLVVRLVEMCDCLPTDVLQDNVNIVTFNAVLDRLEQPESLERGRRFLQRTRNLPLHAPGGAYWRNSGKRVVETQPLLDDGVTRGR